MLTLPSSVGQLFPFLLTLVTLTHTCLLYADAALPPFGLTGIPGIYDLNLRGHPYFHIIVVHYGITSVTTTAWPKAKARPA